LGPFEREAPSAFTWLSRDLTAKAAFRGSDAQRQTHYRPGI
jgi:hypothetical protein